MSPHIKATRCHDGYVLPAAVLVPKLLGDYAAIPTATTTNTETP